MKYWENRRRQAQGSRLVVGLLQRRHPRRLALDCWRTSGRRSAIHCPIGRAVDRVFRTGSVAIV